MIILHKQLNFGLAPQTFGLVTSSNSLPEGQPHLFIFVSPCGTIGHIVAPWKFDALKSSIFALEASLLR